MALRKIFSRINYDTPEEEYILGPIVNKHITKNDVQSMSDRDKITKAFIPQHVTSIEAGAFAGCTNLTEIHIEGTVYDVVWTTSPRHGWDMSLNKKAFLEMLKCGEGTIRIERTYSWN